MGCSPESGGEGIREPFGGFLRQQKGVETVEDPFDGGDYPIPLITNQDQQGMGQPGQQERDVMVIFRTGGRHPSRQRKPEPIHDSMEALPKHPASPIRRISPGGFGVNGGQGHDSDVHLFFVPHPAFGSKQAFINESDALRGKALIEGECVIRSHRDDTLQDGG